jgi:hypothetical protein
MSFKSELRNLINKYSKENDSDTPDFILADHMMRCLRNFNITMESREKWYSRNRVKDWSNDKNQA